MNTAVSGMAERSHWQKMDEDKHMDPAPRRILILDGIATILAELIDLTSSSESEEDELEYVLHAMKERKKLPRLKNYVENIVPAYNDQQFKLHFR